MAEVSNEALALLMVGVIVVVIGSMVSLTWMDYPGITGHASQNEEGTTSVNITQQVEIELTQTDIDFGSGYINGTNDLNLSSNDTSVPTNWINETDYDPDNFNLSNKANVAITVNVEASENAATFIGTGAGMYYARLNNDGGECTGSYSTWQDISDGSSSAVCDNWGENNMDSWIDVALRLELPSDAVGYKNNTFTFTSAAV